MLPVTLLTGFLGAGKTTLINQLIAQHPKRRIAIIENEFGEVNIDRQLLPASHINIIELTNGCICCNIRGELTSALHTLLAQFASENWSIDHLILETTGLADPAPIIQTFFIDETLREKLRLDAVITLVDCAHNETQLNAHRVAVSQVGFADKLLLTKSDLVTESALNETISRLQNINIRADIHFVHQGTISPDIWLNVHAFNLNETQPFGTIYSATKINESSYLLSTKPRATPDNISSFVLRTGRVDLKKIGDFMSELVEKYGNDMLRYKGILAPESDNRKLIVQGVHHVVGFDYGEPWQPHEAPETVIVIISRPLPVEEIQRKFRLAATQH